MLFEKRGLLLACAACFLSAILTGCQQPPEADLILTNGRIITLDREGTVAEAVAIRGERIARVGSNRDVRGLGGRGTRVVDLGGKTVIPGFNDAHLHFRSGGFFLLQVNLVGVTTLEEIERRVRASAEMLPPGAWIEGRGWDHTLLPVSGWPSKDLLDRAARQNPVYLRRVCGHIGWANTAALEAAGVTRGTPDPQGGQIVRDPEGNPTGILKEEACNLVSDVIPKPSKERLRVAIETAMREAARLGVTSVQEMGTSPEALTVYRELHDEGALTVRIYASPAIDSGLVHFPGLGLGSGFGDPWLRLGLLKGFSDGALGAATAALLEPYSDHPGTKGILVKPEEEIRKEILEAHRMGSQVAFHAIGDRGNRVVLDAIEAALDAFPRPDPRHRIEHAQVLAPQDIPRFSELGVIASMQPTHCTSDMRWAGDRLGRERVRGAYAWRSLVDAGARLAFGTDWPVESLDPIPGLYSAATRQDPDGNPAGGWHAEERITVEEALRAYTLGSAHASFEEHLKGSIEEGKLADLVVLSQAVLEIPPEALLETKVLMTIVGGKVVFEEHPEPSR